MNPFFNPASNPFFNPHKERILQIQRKALRKHQMIMRCSMQAKLHKAKLMLRDKGRNGRSMNDALISGHGIQRKGEATV